MPITLEQIFGKPAVQENLRESETCYILREPERLPFPIGWFQLQTRSGLDAGVGFFCPDCKLASRQRLLVSIIVAQLKSSHRKTASP